MIGQIKGRLIGKNAPEILVEVGGITYEILVPMSTLYQLPDLDGMVHLYTHFSVREDAQILYGFFDAESKRMFRSLVRVNGVGPKLALGILSGMSVDEFVQTVKSNDSDSLVKMPGVGKKTAERLIVEMRDKLSEWDSTDVSSNLSLAPNSTFIKDAEIAGRTKGQKEMSDSDVTSILKKMIKQRNESCEVYKKAGRNELLENEQKEIEVISIFLPKQLSDEETKKLLELLGMPFGN